MADPYGNYQANQGLLSGPGLNPQGIDPELLRQITGLLSQTSPTPGLALPAGNMGYGVLQDAATAGKYAMGNPDRLTTDQIIPSVANSAIALGIGGMPMAEAGAAGIFGGRLAQTADAAAFKRAEDLTASRAFPEEIYSQTGTWTGPDTLRRFEIPDTKSQLTPLAKQTLGEGKIANIPLKDLLDHPELYKAYPDLANMPVVVNPNGKFSGHYSPFNDWVTIRGKDPDQVHSLLLHEVQHAVQAREGFTPGASPWGLKLAGEEAMSPENAAAMRYYQYRHNAGETEARNVQARMMMRPDELRQMPPSYTQDIPFDKQLTVAPGILGQR